MIVNTISQLKDSSIFILSALLITALIETSNVNSQETELQTFNNSEIKVNYPSSWEIAPTTNSTFPYYGSDTLVVFKPIGETNPLNITYLNISPLQVGTSLGNTSLAASRDSLDKIVSEQIAFLQDPESFYGNLDVEILANNATTVDSLPAKELIYLIHGLGTFDSEIVVIHGDKQYLLHFTTPISNVSETLPTAQQIIKSLKFNT
ncbi:PsbP-related protein [Candidatus Nitrosocosmicus franklandus]|uniref:PsbP-related protein n=1 Tax=Candidatus Nitrosocosmicus franklandianus TaxID=1798806 RepID=UPI003CC81FE3